MWTEIYGTFSVMPLTFAWTAVAVTEVSFALSKQRGQTVNFHSEFHKRIKQTHSFASTL